jgi:hypothetical protein
MAAYAERLLGVDALGVAAGSEAEWEHLMTRLLGSVVSFPWQERGLTPAIYS